MYPVSMAQEQDLVRHEAFTALGLPSRLLSVVDCVRMHGEVDADVLRSALEQTVNRHAALRSAIRPNTSVPPTARDFRLEAFGRTGICDPGMYQQQIEACGEPILQLSTAAAGNGDAAIAAAVWDESREPFDLTRPPLIRGRLVQVASREYVCILAWPWIAADRYSVGLVWASLFSAYSRLFGEAMAEPSSAQAYEFASWQCEQIHTAFFSPALAYWADRWSNGEVEDDQVGAIAAAYAAPEDNGQPAAPVQGSRSDRLSISGDLAAAIQDTSRRLSISPRVILFAALALWLRETTQRENASIWIPFPNRQDDYEHTVGCLTNHHLLNLAVGRMAGPREVIEHCRSRLLEAETHQALPLALLWMRLGKRCERIEPRVVFEWTVDGSARIPGIEVEPALDQYWRSVFPVGLFMRASARGESFEISVLYSRWSPTAMGAVLRRYRRILEELVGQ